MTPQSEFRIHLRYFVLKQTWQRNPIISWYYAEKKAQFYSDSRLLWHIMRGWINSLNRLQVRSAEGWKDELQAVLLLNMHILKYQKHLCNNTKFAIASNLFSHHLFNVKSSCAVQMLLHCLLISSQIANFTEQSKM